MQVDGIRVEQSLQDGGGLRGLTGWQRSSTDLGLSSVLEALGSLCGITGHYLSGSRDSRGTRTQRPDGKHIVILQGRLGDGVCLFALGTALCCNRAGFINEHLGRERVTHRLSANP